MDEVEVSALIGKTFREVIRDGDVSLRFVVDDDEAYVMFHQEDCCESVTIDDICGDLQDLVGRPITVAREDTNSDSPRVDPQYPDYLDESFTWTFYNLATTKGVVTIRWYGTSNGYYSESVDIVRV